MMSGFGIIQNLLQCACIRWIASHKLFVLNFTILLLNVVFYVVNLRFYPSTIAVHFLTAFEPEQRALLHMTFKAFAEAMDSNNVTYFVFSGTLLGSWRHHDIIPWDDDIDVMINASDRHEVSRVLRTKDQASFGLYDWAKSGKDYIVQWKFYPLNGHSLHDEVYKTPNIDVFFYLENETHIWNASPLFPEEIWPKNHVFPLRRRPFGDLMVPAPCNPEIFLGAHFNVSVCESRARNQIINARMPFPLVRVPCSRLEHLYPFVHREITESSGSEEFVLENLRLRNSTLRIFKARRSC